MYCVPGSTPVPQNATVTVMVMVKPPPPPQVHKLCTFTCLVCISFDGTERDGRCCGLGRPFCSDFSAVGDVLHFHFAQGYRLDVMYFVSTSESETLILDMNHDGD